MSAQPQYSPDQIKQAARNAYSKGDYAGAKRLDGLYQRSLAQQQPQQQPQQQQPAGSQVPQGQRDNAFEYGLDQAQSLYGGLVETVGKKVGSQGMMQYGQNVQEQQEKDMAKGGYQFQYDSFGDAIDKGGLSGFASHGGSVVAAGLPTTGATLVGGGATALAAFYGAPAWAVAALGGATTAGGIGLGIGENALEQKEKTGKLNPDVAIGVGVISGLLDRIGVRKVFSMKDLEKMTTQEIADKLRKKGMGSKAAEFLKGMGAEAITETAQEGTNIAATSALGGEYTGQEVEQRLTDAGITGGLMAGTIKTGTGTVKAATNLVTGGSPSSNMSDQESQAAASYAQRLIKKAEANGYDLRDIDTSSDKGARKAVDSTHVDMSVSLRQLFDDLKPILDIKDTDSLDAVAEKVLAKVAYRKANNKTKNTVEQEDFAAVEKLAGNTQEGRRAINLMHELNQMTTIHNGGYKGGVSQYTDQLAPLGLGGEGYDRGKAISERLLRPLVTAQAFASTGGSSLLGQLGAMGTGRAIDKVTGRRSTVDRFARKYGKQPGQPAPTGPSVREENIADIGEQERLAAEEAERQEQMAAEQRDANLARVEAGAPPQFGSPEDIMRDGTGLDRAEIAQVLRILKANPNTLPAVRRAIDAYEQGIAVGGEMDFSLIRDINAFVDANPNYVQRNRQPNVQRAAATAQAGAQQNLTQRDQNYQRGIENNLAFVKQLQDQLNDDKSVRPIEKAKLLDTLNSMQFDLGADPIAALKAHAERLYDGGVSQDALQQYFLPYMERVQQQQQAAQRKREADLSDSETIASAQDAMDDARMIPIPNANASLVGMATDGRAMFAGKNIDPSVFDSQETGDLGAYIDLDTGENLTGKVFTGGSVSINAGGRAEMNTADNETEAPNYGSRKLGTTFHANLIQNKTPQAKWLYVNKPEGVDHEGALVSVEGGSKHYYTLDYQVDAPMELYSKNYRPLAAKQYDNPVLRPKTKGDLVLGKKVGSIKVKSSGKVHPLYESIRVESPQDQQFNDDRSPQPVGETVAQRKQRAEEQGYDTGTVYYHGTASGFSAFSKDKRGDGTGARSAKQAFFFSDSARTAQSYAHNSAVRLPVLKVLREADAAERKGDFDKYDSLIGDAEALENRLDDDRRNGQNIVPVYLPNDDSLRIKNMRGRSFDDFGVSDEISEELKSAKSDGLKGVKFLNLNDSAGLADDPSTHVAIFEPSNIRSVNAQFDPAKTDSANLSDSRSPSIPALTQVSSPNIISLVDGTETPPKMTVKAEVGNFLQTRALEKLGGIPRDLNDPADRSAIADDLVSEAIYEMESKDSAVEWYDSTIESMLEMLSLKYPEIADDPNAKTPMLVSLAIMSQNLDVPTNLKMAEKAYEYFRENGRFEIHGTGKSLAVMKQNFDKANRMIEKLGSMEAFTEFLQMELPVKDMNTALQGMLGDDGKVGGENMDTVVYGSAIFGPKVGNGFYTNLRGDFTPVTMDMWFMRTVGRLKGDLMEFNEAKFQKQLDRLKTALGRKRISREKLIEEAMRLRKAHEKDYKDNEKLYKAKIKTKSEATLAAETIVKSLTATTDAPKSGGERNILRDLVQEAVAKFNDKTGLNIEPAAFQALIWYPEQDLYKSLGVQLKHVRQDYANSAKQLLKKEGYNENDLNSAIDRVRSRREQRAGQVRQGPGQVDQQAAGPADRRSGIPVQQDQGPILTQDERDIDYTDVTKFLPPTVSKVKDQLPEAQVVVDGIINIGKKGTRFENGIGTQEDLLALADHLDIAVKIYDDAEVYYKESQDTERNTNGRHRGGPRSSEIWVKGKEILGELPAFITLTHEVSHGMENRPENADADDTLYQNNHAHPGATKNRKSLYYAGSLRHKIASAVHSAAWYQGIDYEPDKKYYRDELINSDRVSLTYGDAVKIKNEIEKIQRMAVSNPSMANLGSKNLRSTPDSITANFLKNDLVRLGMPDREITSDEIKAGRKAYKNGVRMVMDPYRKYIREDAEFAVDPVILYLMDPKTMKRVAPVTAKYIRDHFDKANLPVKFHAHPMAVILSILMAGALMKGEEEEEEKMAPGALSPQPALLSA